MGFKWDFWVSLFQVSLFAAVAMANPFQEIQNNRPVCFKKAFDKNHMNARPNQTVQAFDMKFHADPRNGGMITLNLKANILKSNGQTKPYKTTMICDQQTASLHCEIECDGGSADVSWEKTFTDKGIVFRNNGFVLYGGCGEDVDEKDVIWLDPKVQGDDLFILDPSSC